ncbi:MAG: hypothetical protein ACMG55_19975, partial [Microcoleus sp.]
MNAQEFFELQANLLRQDFSLVQISQQSTINNQSFPVAWVLFKFTNSQDSRPLAHLSRHFTVPSE